MAKVRPLNGEQAYISVEEYERLYWPELARSVSALMESGGRAKLSYMDNLRTVYTICSSQHYERLFCDVTSMIQRYVESWMNELLQKWSLESFVALFNSFLHVTKVLCSMLEYLNRHYVLTVLESTLEAELLQKFQACLGHPELGVRILDAMSGDKWPAEVAGREELMNAIYLMKPGWEAQTVQRFEVEEVSMIEDHQMALNTTTATAAAAAAAAVTPNSVQMQTPMMMTAAVGATTVFGGEGEGVGGGGGSALLPPPQRSSGNLAMDALDTIRMMNELAAQSAANAETMEGSWERGPLSSRAKRRATLPLMPEGRGERFSKRAHY